MDQTLLVDHEIQDVPRLIAELRKDHFIPKAAFWLYSSEDDAWKLCFVLGGVKEHGSRNQYLTLVKAMRRTDDLWIDPFAVKIVDSNDPLAQAVLEHLSTYPAEIPTRIRNARLGGVFVDAAYIYPNAVVSGP